MEWIAIGALILGVQTALATVSGNISAALTGITFTP
jgi:hypothetical protein